MKKITLKIAAIVLLSSIVFFACKKEKAVDECTTLEATFTTTYAAEITATQTAFARYNAPGGKTDLNCVTLNTAADALKAKASKCPVVLESAIIKPLIDYQKTLPCITP